MAIPHHRCPPCASGRATTTCPIRIGRPAQYTDGATVSTTTSRSTSGRASQATTSSAVPRVDGLPVVVMDLQPGPGQPVVQAVEVAGEHPVAAGAGQPAAGPPQIGGQIGGGLRVEVQAVRDGSAGW